MTQARYNRKPPDLVTAIARLTERINKLETRPRLGSTSIDSGELVLNGGDIVIKNSAGEVVLRVQSGNSPAIRIYPSGSAVATNYQIKTFGWESDTSGTAYQASIQNGSGAQDGGKLLLMQGAAYLSHQPNGSLESYYGAGIGADGILYMKGRFGNNFMVDNEAALVVGSVSVAAGVSSYSHTYATASTGTMIPVVQMLNSAGALGGCLTAQSNSGFTFAWTGTLAKTINYWAFRI